MKENKRFEIPGISQEELEKDREAGRKENEEERKRVEAIYKDKKTPIKQLNDIRDKWINEGLK